MKTYCIILASGSGTRFGGSVPKQFVEIYGHMVIEYTIDVCLRTEVIDEIIIVVSNDWIDVINSFVETLNSLKRIRVVLGGATRKESCLNGVSAISDNEAKVLIHNGVQPFVTVSDLSSCVQALDRYNAVSVGSPSVYTVLELDNNRELKRVIERRHSVNDLGPECFKISFLRHLFDVVGGDDSCTNITGMALKYKLGPVYVVEGDPSNVKITYAEDLLAAERKFAGYKFLETKHD